METCSGKRVVPGRKSPLPIMHSSVAFLRDARPPSATPGYWIRQSADRSSYDFKARNWRGPHQTGQGACAKDFAVMNSRGEWKRYPLCGWLVL